MSTRITSAAPLPLANADGSTRQHGARCVVGTSPLTCPENKRGQYQHHRSLCNGDQTGASVARAERAGSEPSVICVKADRLGRTM